MSKEQHQVLNPQGVMPVRETIPLGPRLKSLKGKTVWIVGRESDELLMPLIAKLLPEFAPGVNAVYMGHTPGGDVFFESPFQPKPDEYPDAAIIGNGF